MSTNPILLIQLYRQYGYYRPSGNRTFRFTRNNRMVIHKETDKEAKKRKSTLSDHTAFMTGCALYESLCKSLKGRLGKVWVNDIDEAERIAIDLQASTGSSGFGVLPTGSRKVIPEGKKIRAFTYWEKVDDIDLSCFGLAENGETFEFSWRSMWGKQSEAVTFSGDQTDGYCGGSEFFDIDIDRFREEHPKCRWILFCDNIYSNYGMTHFKHITATGGYMIRDTDDSGEIFEPKTVETSFRLTTDSSFSYMFAIDLQEREMIWLNISRDGNHAIAGDEEMSYLIDVMEKSLMVNVYEVLEMCGTITQNKNEADVIFSDDPEDDRNYGDKVLHSWDTEKILALVQPR